MNKVCKFVLEHPVKRNLSGLGKYRYKLESATPTDVADHNMCPRRRGLTLKAKSLVDSMVVHGVHTVAM